MIEKSEGKISIRINKEYTEIEIKDKESRISFLNVKLSPEQLSRALSKEAYVECEFTTNRIKDIGKKKMNDRLILEVPEHLNSYGGKNEILNFIKGYLKDDWELNDTLTSKDSFFLKDDKTYVNCRIKRYE